MSLVPRPESKGSFLTSETTYGVELAGIFESANLKVCKTIELEKILYLLGSSDNRKPRRAVIFQQGNNLSHLNKCVCLCVFVLFPLLLFICWDWVSNHLTFFPPFNCSASSALPSFIILFSCFHIEQIRVGFTYRNFKFQFLVCISCFASCRMCEQCSTETASWFFIYCVYHHHIKCCYMGIRADQHIAPTDLLLAHFCCKRFFNSVNGTGICGVKCVFFLLLILRVIAVLLYVRRV